MYRELIPAKLVEATEILAARIKERFPEAGLTGVADDLVAVAKRTAVISYEISKPLWPQRIGAMVVTAGLLAILGILGMHLRVSTNVSDIVALVQGLESLVNDVFFACIAVWFAFSIEGRIKRSRALKLMSQLRSMAHVIDMHQLDKDPDRFDPEFKPMLRSPKPGLTRISLTRYLDYCSDMLSILGKLAAVAVQNFEDPVALSAVNEVENLSGGLSRKVWQKIMILDRMATEPVPSTAETA